MAVSGPLRVGTHSTLLGLAHGRAIVRALRVADPGLQVELVPIATRGDSPRPGPLGPADHPTSTSDELHAALLSGLVECCVHAVQNLPADSRDDLATAAMPLRGDPRDVVVFRAGILDRLRSGTPVRVGSSADRHDRRTCDLLAALLPAIGAARPDVRLESLHGSFPDGLRRLGLGESDGTALDGVVLAIAELNRLWSDRDAHAAIAPGIDGARFMVMPLSACPTAPGQGALAVECRRSDQLSRATLAVLDDPVTAGRVRRERELLVAQPESERSRFAATSVRSENCGTVIFTRGGRGDQAFSRTLWNRPAKPGSTKAWDGGDWVRMTEYQPLRSVAVTAGPAAFISHWRALDGGARLPSGTRVWVSGVTSWIRLAGQGVWVEGCADNLGFGSIAETLAAPALRLPPVSAWTVLTRADTAASWRDSGVGSVIPTYAIGAPTDERVLADIRRTIGTATHFFWGSAAQFLALRDCIPANSHHACGPGRTYQALLAAGVENLQAFPSRAEWHRWVN